MDIDCPYCYAVFFPQEGSSFFTCCAKGSTKLSTFREPPEPLRTLLYGPDDPSDVVAVRRRQHFHRHIRRFNNIFSFGAFRAHADNRTQYNPFAFIIQGQPYTINQPLEFHDQRALGANGQSAIPVHAKFSSTSTIPTSVFSTEKLSTKIMTLPFSPISTMYYNP